MNKVILSCFLIFLTGCLDDCGGREVPEAPTCQSSKDCDEGEWCPTYRGLEAKCESEAGNEDI